MTFPFPQMPPSAQFAFSNTANPSPSTTSSGTKHSFTSVSIGAADSGRYVVVCANASWNGVIGTFTGITINGVTASQILTASGVNAGVENARADQWIALVPAGTSVTIDANLSNAIGSNRAVQISVWRVVNPSNGATPYASNSDSDNGTTTPALTLDVNTVNGGGVIANVCANAVGGSTTWTGASEVVDSNAGTTGFTGSAAGNAIVSGSTPLAISADFTNGGGGQAGVSTSWR